jgi:2-phosphosulfolactate phosphatase
VDPFVQAGFDARVEWGEDGVRSLAPEVHALVIVDVLSFTTAVDVATSRGASVLPYPYRDSSAEAFAAEQNAVLAVSRYDVSAQRPYSLSPGSLARIPRGTRLVLPSPNGSRLSKLAAGDHLIVAGCLRNADAVAAWARSVSPVGVIAAGELRRDGGLRFAIEDLVGAGAILSHFPTDQRSPEANVAVAAFESVAGKLPRVLAECASGRELAGVRFADDVRVAAELDVSATVPVLIQGGTFEALTR